MGYLPHPEDNEPETSVYAVGCTCFVILGLFAMLFILAELSRLFPA